MGLAPKRVLVVDDVADTRELITALLTGDGMEVQSCADGAQALSLISTRLFDLILADIRMPGLQGTDLLQAIRDLGLETPVILMTAYPTFETAVAALRGRAVDYLSKPLTIEELRRCISNAFALSGTGRHLRTILEYRDLLLDERDHKAWKADQELALTPLEFSVLAYLMKHPGRPITIDELLQCVWRINDPEGRNPITVKTCIFRLREKIEDNPRDPKYIRNVWGIGYQLGK